MSIQHEENVLLIEKPQQSKSRLLFHLHRLLSMLVLVVLYMLVTFQRTCTAVLVDYMYKDQDFSTFSSMYFWPYAAVQIFAGVLADVFEPGFLIGGSQLIASIGVFICGASHNIYAIALTGRFLVGLGCGPCYVTITRFVNNWFLRKNFSIVIGIIFATSGLGGILAQAPLRAALSLINWQTSFYIVGGIYFAFSITCLFFVRGDPISRGFPPVNKDVKITAAVLTFREKLWLLFGNVKTVLKNKYFWAISLWSMCFQSKYYATAGLLIVQYLMHIGINNAAIVAMGMSIGSIASSIIVPPLSTCLGTKKWVLACTSLLAVACCAVFAFVDNSKLNSYIIFVILFFLGGTSICMTNVAYPLLSAYYPPDVVSTAVGSANFFAYISSGVVQVVVGIIVLKTEGGRPNYKYGLWVFCLILCGVGFIVICLVKDSASEKVKQHLIETEGKQEPEVEEKGKASYSSFGESGGWGEINGDEVKEREDGVD